MTARCPCCGQSLPQQPDREAELWSTVADLRDWCAANGVAILPGELIREEAAARALGRNGKTLQNWRANGDPLPTNKIRGRHYCRLIDIAREIVSR